MKRETINTLAEARQWQADFTESLFGELKDTLQQRLSTHSKHNEPLERFSVYRNNVFYSLRNALADLYPTVKKLVGENFFNGTAHLYLQQNPPAKAAMVYFAWNFPEFLSRFEHTQNLPYLHDIAKLELARHQSYHAKDAANLDAAFFATIAADTFEHSRFALHPSIQFMHSAFPILTIWQANQGEDDGDTIDLNEPQYLITVRIDYAVHTIEVDPASYCFYQALSQACTIYEAASITHKQYPNSDISQSIAVGIQNGFFSAQITCDKNEE